MNTTRAEYLRRYTEIEEYINYLDTLDRQTGNSVSLMATMKASALLMLYNLVESTMTNISQAVFDHLRQNNVGLNNLNNVMKTLVISNIRKRNPAKLVEKMQAESIDIAVASFDRSDVYSGNVDGKKIRDTFIDFGIVNQNAFKEPVLLEIKTVRNDLAHGAKSFSDTGKTYTVTDLRLKQTKVGSGLTRVLTSFESYLVSKSYK